MRRLINTSNRFSELPVHIAACEGTSETVSLYIEAGADIEVETRRWGTALLAACTGGRFDTVQLLVLRGARISYERDGEIFSAFKAAKHFPEIIRWLLIDRHNFQRRLNWSSDSTPNPNHDTPIIGGREAVLQYWRLGRLAKMSQRDKDEEREEEEAEALARAGVVREPWLLPWK